MIEPADKYRYQLERLVPPDNPWYHYEFPCHLVGHNIVSTHNGGILGKFAVITNVLADSVVEISAQAYSDKRTYVFGKDLMTGLRYLMDTYRKVCFSVMIGNPKEKVYDRHILPLGFTTCLRRAEIKDKNGTWHDVKIYEYVNPRWRPDNDPA
jgi:hypothetical protein